MRDEEKICGIIRRCPCRGAAAAVAIGLLTGELVMCIAHLDCWQVKDEKEACSNRPRIREAYRQLGRVRRVVARNHDIMYSMRIEVYADGIGRVEMITDHVGRITSVRYGSAPLTENSQVLAREAELVALAAYKAYAELARRDPRRKFVLLEEQRRVAEQVRAEVYSVRRNRETTIVVIPERAVEDPIVFARL